MPGRQIQLNKTFKERKWLSSVNPPSENTFQEVNKFLTKDSKFIIIMEILQYKYSQPLLELSRW